MSSDSFQLLGMAERGFLPACLARRSRHDTPTLAIILSSVGICTLSMFDFRQVSVSQACNLTSTDCYVFLWIAYTEC